MRSRFVDARTIHHSFQEEDMNDPEPTPEPEPTPPPLPDRPWV